VQTFLNKVNEINGKSLCGKESSTGMPEFSSIKLMRNAASIATTLPAAQTLRNGGNSRPAARQPSLCQAAMLVAAEPPFAEDRSWPETV
jgi:hypothetical protein